MLAFGFTGFMLGMAIVGVSLLLIGLILLQKNRGAGLSGAFGGVGGHSAFGTKTGDFLTWVTVGLVAVFLLLNIAANYVFVPEKAPAAPEKAELIDDAGADETPDGQPAATPVTPTPIQVTPTGNPGPPVNAVPVTPTNPPPSSNN